MPHAGLVANILLLLSTFLLAEDGWKVEALPTQQEIYGFANCDWSTLTPKEGKVIAILQITVDDTSCKSTLVYKEGSMVSDPFTRYCGAVHTVKVLSGELSQPDWREDWTEPGDSETCAWRGRVAAKDRRNLLREVTWPFKRSGVQTGIAVLSMKDVGRSRFVTFWPIPASAVPDALAFYRSRVLKESVELAPSNLFSRIVGFSALLAEEKPQEVVDRIFSGGLSSAEVALYVYLLYDKEVEFKDRPGLNLLLARLAESDHTVLDAIAWGLTVGKVHNLEIRKRDRVCRDLLMEIARYYLKTNITPPSFLDGKATERDTGDGKGL